MTTEYVDPPSQLAVTEAALAAVNARIAKLEAALLPFAEKYEQIPQDVKIDFPEAYTFLRGAYEALRPTQQPAPEPPAIPTLSEYGRKAVERAEQKGKRT